MRQEPTKPKPSARRSLAKPSSLWLMGLAGIGIYLYSRAPSGGVAEASGGGGAPAASALIKVDSVVVNLADEEELHYIKISLELQLAQTHEAEAVTARMAVVRNEIILFLSSLSSADTRGEKLKSEILTRIVVRLNKAFAGETFKRAYFNEFVVQ